MFAIVRSIFEIINKCFVFPLLPQSIVNAPSLLQGSDHEIYFDITSNSTRAVSKDIKTKRKIFKQSFS